MNKEQKIASLANAMTCKTRDDGTEFYCFTDEAPQELRDLFLEHYTIRDVDYETFSDACRVIEEVYGEHTDKDGRFNDIDIEEAIYERSGDRASVYTSERLGYLNMWNEYEVSDIMSEYSAKSIANACAIWYDKQVEEQAMIIKNWIEEA